MKPFNLEKAKAGKPVCTRDGKPARIICFNVKDELFPIVGLVTENDGFEVVETFTKYGNLVTNTVAEHDYDLMMASEKHEGWINIYRDKGEHSLEPFPGSYIHNSEQAAKKASEDISIDSQHVATIKIEWEE